MSATETTQLDALLEGIAGRRLAREAFELGPLLPHVAFAPADAEAFGEVQRRCDAQGLAAVVFGGGTLQTLGALPERYDLALSTAALTRIVEYEPRDLTIGVEAGITLANLSQALARHGQFVPIDAPEPARATLGGTLAAGWLGPRRGAFGRPRDAIIGTTAALADGTISRAGGMVVKNVTGYDVSKLFVGSLGTLGTLLRVNLKTSPRPPAMRVATAPLPEETCARALEHLAQSEIEPSCILWIRGWNGGVDGKGGADGSLLMVLEGTQSVVDRATRELRSALGSAGVPSTNILDHGAPEVYQRALDLCTAQLEGRSVTYRVSGLPDGVLERTRIVEELARLSAMRIDTVVDVHNGDTFARFVAADPLMLAQSLPELSNAVHARLEHATLVSGAYALRNGIDPWGAVPPGFSAMRTLKAQFDPHRTLAPGRLVGGL